MLFDTHTHLQFSAFQNNLDEVIKKSKAAGVEKMVIVGTDINSSKKAIEIALANQNVFAAIGIHPHHIFEHLSRHSEADAEESQDKNLEISHQKRIRDDKLGNELKEIEKLLIEPKVIALGETGMDRHHYPNTKYPSYSVSKEFLELQRQAFAAQIKLALKYQKSLIIHNRQAVFDLLDVLDVHLGGVQSLAGRAVFHMCEPDQRLLDFAKKNKVYIGVGGDVTYDKEKQDFVKKIPLDLLVLETDSPFLVPKGFNFPNTPINLNFIADYIAKIIEIDSEKLKKITYKNSLTLFKLL